MNLKTFAALILKIAALTVVYLVCFILASGLTIMPLLQGQPMEAEANASAAGLPVVALLNTLALAYPILRSRWHGWRLAVAIFFVYYGVYTFMSQIETAVFLPVVNRLVTVMLPALFAMGVLLAALFAPPAVFILGRWKASPAADEPNTRLIMPAREWAWKLAVIAVAYVILYFTFGYYVAWKNPAVQAYYGGSDPGSFFAQMQNVMRDTPWMPFFQMLRALLWTLFALPVIRMMKGAWWETGLAVALLFAVPMNAGLLLPNPIMPEAVRLTHLIETASSNFIFGWLVAWLLSQRRAPLPAI